MRNYPYSIVFIIAMFCSCVLFAGDYEKAWEAIENHEYGIAKKHFEAAVKSGEKKQDALLALSLLESYRKNDSRASEHFSDYCQAAADPGPVLFAWWFQPFALGDYGKKTGDQLQAMQWVKENEKLNGSLRTAADYYYGMHQTFSADLDDAQETFSEIAAVRNWQYVGPFDNLQNSGMSEEFGPLENPEKSAAFKTQYNAKIQWFAPTHEQPEGWITPEYHIPGSSDLIYTQTFINSPKKQMANLALGYSGTIKLYVNDALVFENSKTIITELDAFMIPISLNSGSNRIVVKLGYNDVSNPNFMIRLLDENKKDLKGISSSPSYKAYTKSNLEKVPTYTEHFSYAYFRDKIKAEPNNILNYILLSDALLRNYETDEAGKILKEAKELAPKNVFVQYELLDLYSKTNNETEEGKVSQWLLDEDADSFNSRMRKMSEEFERENYEEAEKIANEIREEYGRSYETDMLGISFLFVENKVMEAVDLVNTLYKRYPDESQLTIIKHSIDKEMNNNPKGAVKILEKFLDDNYNYQIEQILIREYSNIGRTKDAIKLYEERYEMFPYNPDVLSELAGIEFERQNYDEAIDYLKMVEGLAPYSTSNFSQMALIYENSGEEDKALKYYDRALEYNPFQYDSRDRIRKLKDKPQIIDHLNFTDPKEAEEKFGLSDLGDDYSFYYLLDEVNQVIYANGPSEAYYQYMIKILKKDGIESWQSFSLPSSGYERLQVMEAELWKADGSKAELEKYGSEIVAANLEVGDIIYCKYKLRSFVRGRSSKYFSHKYAFNSYVPNGRSAYRLIIDENTPYKVGLVNSEVVPVEDKIEGFKIRSWESVNPPVIKEEKLMPSFTDIGSLLHISSNNDWKDIVNWYQDISKERAKMDYSLEEALEEIFPNGWEDLSEDDRAKKIYYHLLDRTTYSSISFRQSGIIPQRAADVYTTGLADCKDISTLYATLCREVDLDVDLVLINTADNGYKDVLLPSLDFNHCIVKLNSGTQPRYLELTDRYLPFGSLYASHWNASILEIPFEGDAANAKLLNLDIKGKTLDAVIRKKNVKVNGRDVMVSVDNLKTGASAGSSRGNYDGLSNKEQMDQLENSIGSKLENPVEVTELEFENLEALEDSFKYDFKYKVEKAIKKIGSFETFALPFSDILANNRVIDTEDDRAFGMAYQFYEDVDLYEEEMTIELEAGKQFIELPENVNLTYGKAVYAVTFTKISSSKLIVKRTFKTERLPIDKGELEKFREFMGQIQETENTMVAFK